MPWQDEMIPTLRVMLNDLSETAPTYSDDRLEQVLVVAAKMVSAELGLTDTYRISVANVTMSPDPTAAATKNDSFVNLVTLKAACVVDRGVALVGANRAIYVKDGASAIDLRGVSEAKLKLLEKGWCAVYEDAKFEHQNGLAGAAGAMVLTPFRLYLNSLPGDE
jgi:uncharacterized protein (UPF0210 family)